MQAILKNNKIVIEFDVGEVDKNILSLFSSIEISKKSQATEKEIYQLSKEIKEEWWRKNKRRFIDENSVGYRTSPIFLEGEGRGVSIADHISYPKKFETFWGPRNPEPPQKVSNEL